MESSAPQVLKIAILSVTGLSKDALHVHAGLAVFLTAALSMRKPMHSAGNSSPGIQHGRDR